MRVVAPAKINLHLRVGPRRADGFHGLVSWMCTVGLFDNLSFERVRRGDRRGISFSCDHPGLPIDSTNLVVRAAEGLARATGSGEIVNGVTDQSDFAIHLQKRIPFGAGLGGGSADGARTLVALNHLWRLGWTAPQLAEFSAGFGSDIPFFMYEPSALCTGRGDYVTPLARPAASWCVLVLPDIHCSTPAIYRQFDAMGLGTDLQSEPPIGDWPRLLADELLPRLVNDLEPAAFAVSPELQNLRASIEQSISRPIRMSGSGSSLFTLYDEPSAAEQAARGITAQHHVRAIAAEIAPVLRDDLCENLTGT